MNGYGHWLQHVFHQLFTGRGRCVIATCFYTPLKLATTIDLQRSRGLGKLVNGSLNCGSDMGIIQWKCEARPLFTPQDLSISPKAIQASKGHWLQHVFHQLFTGRGRCVIATCFYTPLKLATTIDLQRSKGLGKLVNGSLNCIYIYIWSNYSDLTRPISPKSWFSKGNPLISGKSRLGQIYIYIYIITYYTYCGGGRGGKIGRQRDHIALLPKGMDKFVL